MTPIRPALLAERPALRVRVKPGASREAVLGRMVMADGQEAVVVAVSAPPEGGRANKAVIELLAAAIGLPRRHLSVATGPASRTKLIDFGEAGTGARARVAAWVESLPVL